MFNLVGNESLTDHPLFAYQCAQFLLNTIHGSDGAKYHHFTYKRGRPVRLTIYNADNEAVLNDTVANLQRRLREVKNVKADVVQTD